MFSSMNILSIFYTLEYWKELLVIYLMDPMHLVKNIASSLYRYIMNKEANTNTMRNEVKFIEKLRSL